VCTVFPIDIRIRLVLFVAVWALAGAVAPMAQQSAGAGAGSPAQTTPSPTLPPSPQAAEKPQGAAPPGSQEPSFLVKSVLPDDEEPVVRIRRTTRRVVVDVVVTGADGKPVSDLNAGDFAVFEDRKPQSVRAFEIHTPEIDLSPLPPAPTHLPSHTFVNLEATPASGPAVVVLLDFLNSSLTDQAYAHEQIVRFLGQKPASMQVAIFALGDQLSLLQGFTTDSSKLLAAMHTRAAGMHMPSASEQLMHAQITLDAFLEVGRLLTTMSGRKNLLWFSGSFDMLVLPRAQDVDAGVLNLGVVANSPNPGPGPTVTDSNLLATGSPNGSSEASSSGFSQAVGDMTVLRERMRKVTAALALSQTAVYPIDVRGLTVDPGSSAAAPAGSVLTTNPKGQIGTPGMPSQPGAAPANAQSRNDFMQSLNASHATMEEIAQATGGQAFENSNGIARAAASAVRDGASYYTLVYAPSNLNFDGGLRTIHVTVDKPGYRLAYRSAYYAVDPAEIDAEAAPASTLSAAMLHGAPQAQELLFKAQIDPVGEPIPATPNSPLAAKAAYQGARKSKKPAHLSGMVQPYEIRLAILAQQLLLTVTPDGRHHAALQIAVYAYAADGQRLGGSKQELEASLPPVIYERALQDGMFHNLKVQLPVEAATLRMAIVDPASHRAGSLEIALPLPAPQP